MVLFERKLFFCLIFCLKGVFLKKEKINKKCYYFFFGLNIYVFKINFIVLVCLVYNYVCFVYKI